MQKYYISMEAQCVYTIKEGEMLFSPIKGGVFKSDFKEVEISMLDEEVARGVMEAMEELKFKSM